MKNKYAEFLCKKQIIDEQSGFDVEIEDLNGYLFDWQKVIVKWALKRGRSALFEGCGQGKTVQSLEWSQQIHNKEKEPILIFAPLAVSLQTKQEGLKFGYDVNVCSSKNDVKNGINITNYEKMHKFNSNDFIGIVLDESGILKNFASKTRNEIIDRFGKIKYRLACTATPSPNDFAELGNHAEFLGIMSRSEMLATFFINDTANTGTWRLKGHVKDNVFWKWLASWSVMLTKPSDIGFSDEGFLLPEIRYHQHVIKTDYKPKYGLFTEKAKTLNDRRRVRKETIKVRCQKAADLVNSTDEKWVVWCGLNDEGILLKNLVNDSLEVAGRHSNDVKSKRMLDFCNGKLDRLVSKAKIAGHGLNMQCCSNAVFVGLSDSFEQLYQAIRRIYRFGQKEKVDIHIIIEEREGLVLENIQRKEKQFDEMISGMVKYMKDITTNELKSSKRTMIDYNPKIVMEMPKWME